MGFNVGMPMLGLKRGEAKGKHSGNIRSIVEEMGEERYSTSATLDRSKSSENIYFSEHKSGRKCVEAMLAELEEYEIEYKKTSYRGRGLRADATVGVAFIVKPESEWINNQSPEDIEKFFTDAHQCLTELGIVSPETERMRVRHMDEGAPHEHYAIMAYDNDGKIRGSNIVNLKTFRKLNQSFPKMMQKRGWDVNELSAYDADAVKDMSEDEAKAYKDAHIEKKKQKRHGLATNEYIAEKEAEKVADLKAKQETIQSELADLEPKHKRVKQEVKEAEDKKKVVEDETYNASYKAHSLARNLEQAMGLPKSHRPLDELIEDAEERFKGVGERESRIADKEAQIARQRQEMRLKEQEADKFIQSLESMANAPTSKENWMIDWFKQYAPKAFNACEVAYKKANGAKERLVQRRNQIFRNAEDIEQSTQNGRNDYTK